MLRREAASRQDSKSMRPQSAFTTGDPDNIMNKTFNESEFSAADYGEQDVADQIGSQTEEHGQVLNRLNITNILELSKQQTQIIEKVKQFMRQQETELNSQIEKIQKQMFESMANPSAAKEVEEEEEIDLTA